MVDPIWNSSAANDEMYKEVMIDIYGPESVNLNQVSDEDGM